MNAHLHPVFAGILAAHSATPAPSPMSYALSLLADATPTHTDLLTVAEWLKKHCDDLYQTDPRGAEYGGASDAMCECIGCLQDVGKEAEQADADEQWERTGRFA